MAKPFASLRNALARRVREDIREDVIFLQREVTHYERYFTEKELADIRKYLGRVRLILGEELES